MYLSQCHGWLYFESLSGFSTQRGNLYDTVEDLHNPEGADQYLTRYLENAGSDLSADLAFHDSLDDCTDW